MDSPSGRVPEHGPDWFSVAIEACGGGTPDLFIYIYIHIYIGERSRSGGCSRGPGDRGAPRRGGRTLLSPGLLEALLT